MENSTRICTKCGIDKPITEYHRDKRAPGGLRRQCKICRCTQTMEWWYDNQERQLQRHRDYVDANRDRVREIDNERYYRNRDERLGRALAVTHARRAKAQGAEFDLTVTRAALRDLQGDACHYCQRTMDFVHTGRPWPSNKVTVDHVIPISKGGAHSLDNAVLACWSCNSRKGSGDAEVFQDSINRQSAGDAPVAS